MSQMADRCAETPASVVPMSVIPMAANFSGVTTGSGGSDMMTGGLTGMRSTPLTFDRRRSGSVAFGSSEYDETGR
eukprot:1187948-Prorocentrum_minimum.AAC.2